MPSAKTYQAIGFITYHMRLRRRQEELRRAALSAALVGAAIAAAAIAARRDEGRPPS